MYSRLEQTSNGIGMDGYACFLTPCSTAPQYWRCQPVRQPMCTVTTVIGYSKMQAKKNSPSRHNLSILPLRDRSRQILHPWSLQLSIFPIHHKRNDANGEALKSLAEAVVSSQSCAHTLGSKPVNSRPRHSITTRSWKSPFSEE